MTYLPTFEDAVAIVAANDVVPSGNWFSLLISKFKKG